MVIDLDSDIEYQPEIKKPKICEVSSDGKYTAHGWEVEELGLRPGTGIANGSFTHCTRVPAPGLAWKMQVW